MAGYDGFSKSINALDAEATGYFPASTLARKLKVKTGAIQALLEPSEWHHTSSHYNRTNYYASEDALEIIQALRDWKPAPIDVEIHEDVAVEWIEWSGSRNYPKATHKRLESATVTVKGDWATIQGPVGKPFRKRLTTRGFRFGSA